MRRSVLRLAALASLTAVPLGAVLAATAALAGDEPTPAVELRLVSPLPDWSAPGGRFSLRGLAVPGEPVAVRAGGRGLGRTIAGRRGRFRLIVRAPRRTGRFTLVLQGRDRRAPVGDVNLDHGATDAWASVARVLRGADLTVANLECAVSTGGLPVAGKEYTFRGPPTALRAVA